MEGYWMSSASGSFTLCSGEYLQGRGTSVRTDTKSRATTDKRTDVLHQPDHCRGGLELTAHEGHHLGQGCQGLLKTGELGHFT